MNSIIIQYKPYEDKYYQDLKKITLSAFKLTSFNTDKQIPSHKAKQIAWELWCKPVLKSDKKKYCILAVKDNKAIGYIIYGVNAEYGKILNLKIGSIILIAIDEKYQGKHKIAQTLLKYVINVYSKYHINVITVGTDIDNLPAFINYIKNGFQPMLFWSTYRIYPSDQQFKKNNNIKIKEEVKITDKILKQFHRPVSLLIDNRIKNPLKKKLAQFIRKKIAEDVKNGKIKLFSVIYKGDEIAFFTIIKENRISDILGKGLFRINDIVLLKKDNKLNKKVLNYFIIYLKNKFRNLYCIEVFIKSNNWELIKLLEQTDFHLIHNAVTLHKFM